MGKGFGRCNSGNQGVLAGHLWLVLKPLTLPALFMPAAMLLVLVLLTMVATWVSAAVTLKTIKDEISPSKPYKKREKKVFIKLNETFLGVLWRREEQGAVAVPPSFSFDRMTLAGTAIGVMLDKEAEGAAALPPFSFDRATLAGTFMGTILGQEKKKEVKTAASSSSTWRPSSKLTGHEIIMVAQAAVALIVSMIRPFAWLLLLALVTVVVAVLAAAISFFVTKEKITLTGPFQKRFKATSLQDNFCESYLAPHLSRERTALLQCLRFPSTR